MRPVSDVFAAAIQQSHRIAAAATVSRYTQSLEVPVLDGTVTLDQRAAVRGRLDLTITPDPTLDLVPSDPADLLTPYGSELTVRRGIRYPDASSELVSLGVFRVQECEITDNAAGQQIRVTGLDRAQVVIDARFEEPYQVPAGTNYATAIREVLAAGYPSIETAFTATSRTTPALVAQEGDDRWAFAQEMAKAIGMDLYFDGDGVCVLVPSSTVGSSQPVATIAEGAAGVLIDVGRRWSREGTFNRVIATGENTGQAAPARGVATDDNPASPTLYGGPFGRVPRFYVSQFLASDAQAAEAAAAILARELGTTQQVQFGAIVNPALEPGDIARITRARSGIDEDHIIDQLTIPLGPAGVMTGITRATQVT